MKNLILKGKRWLGKRFGKGAEDVAGRRPADSGPETKGRPAAPHGTPLPAGQDSVISPPPSVHRPPSNPHPGAETSISDGLREKILACSLLKRSVEEEMPELCRTYRKSTPPSRLQLCPQVYHKGDPPWAVYWVRLSRAKKEFDPETHLPIARKRRHWFKVLRIRTRRDLHDEIHRDGLDKHRAAIMAFYDRWWAVNKSRSTVAKAMRYAKLALKCHLESSGPRKEASRDPMMDPLLKFVEGSGAELIDMAWEIGRKVEETLSSLRKLEERLTRLPFRRINLTGPGGVGQTTEWQHIPSGKRFRSPNEPSLKELKISLQDLASLGAAIRERDALTRILHKRIGIMNGAECRLAQAHGDAVQVLEQTPPVEPVPWVPGY